MPNTDELNAAVAAGVLARADADRLAAFLVQYRANTGFPDSGTGEDAESVRFVRGFHDIFLTIGIVLLVTGIGYTTQIVYQGGWPYTVAVASWLLAEYFTAAKRLTLPSITLSIAFGIAGGLVLTALGIGVILAPLADSVNSSIALGAGRMPNAIPAISMLIGSAVFYLRFRLPFTLAQMVVAAALAVALILHTPGTSTKMIFLLMGLLTFLAALTFDLKDPERRTISADNAFWLHLTAAPLIVHSAIGFVWTDDVSNLTLPAALTTMAIIFGLAFIALLIDRRALLVAGLFYFGAALFIVIRNTAIEEGAVFAVTILILGGSLLLLGVGWRPLRRAIVSALMPPDIARRLPTVRSE